MSSRGLGTPGAILRLSLFESASVCPGVRKSVGSIVVRKYYAVRIKLPGGLEPIEKKPTMLTLGTRGERK